PGDDVEEGGLAGAVGADQPVDLPAPDLDADVGERLQAAEALAHAGDRQDDVARRLFGAGPHRVRDDTGCHRVRRAHVAEPWVTGTAAGLSFSTSGRRPWRGTGQSPLGRYSMISTMAEPKSSMRSASGATYSWPKRNSCAGL